MGVSAEQRLSYQTCAASSNGLDGGFAPRQLRHSMPRGKIQFCIWLAKYKDLIHLQSLMNLLNEFERDKVRTTKIS
jgi:hypothetical protein